MISQVLLSYLVDRVADVAYGQVYSDVHKADLNDVVAFVVGGVVLVVELLVPFGVGPLVAVVALVDVAGQLLVAPCDAVVQLLAVGLLAAAPPLLGAGLVLFVAVMSVVGAVFVLVLLCVELALTETKPRFISCFRGIRIE